VPCNRTIRPAKIAGPCCLVFRAVHFSMSDDGCTRRTRGLRVSGSSPKCVISLREISWLASLEMEARSRPVLPIEDNYREILGGCLSSIWKAIPFLKEGTSSESQESTSFISKAEMPHVHDYTSRTDIGAIPRDIICSVNLHNFSLREESNTFFFLSSHSTRESTQSLYILSAYSDTWMLPVVFRA